MTLRELEIFKAVAECGRMSEAARKLYITQSSVSQAIASIESEFGIRLFDRLSNGLYITEEGRQLLAYTRNLFTIQQDITDFLTEAAHIHRLRIGATVTVGTCVLNQIISSLREDFPEIRLTVEVANTKQLEEMLLKNEIDIGLVEGSVSSPDLLSRNVIPDSMVLACSASHPLCGKDTVSSEDLKNEKFILREKGSGTRAFFENQMNARGIPLHVNWTCCNSEAIRNAVEAGNGITVISRRLVEEDARAGKLHLSDISDLEMQRYFSVVYHKNKLLSEEMSSFIRACDAFAAREKQKS